jgi:ribosomal protein S27AE
VDKFASLKAELVVPCQGTSNLTGLCPSCGSGHVLARKLDEE